jgi:hypothetical protein
MGEGSPRTPVAITIRLTNDRNVRVLERTVDLQVAAFNGDRQLTYRYPLPLSTLDAGEFWLAIQATVGKKSATSDVRFQVYR